LLKTQGESLTLPNFATANSYFTRTGFTVNGWSTAANGSTKNFDLGGSYTADSATTLYPYWQPDLIAFESFNAGNFPSSLTGYSGGTGSTGFVGNWLAVNSKNSDGVLAGSPDIQPELV
jgi:hypothetical protein